MGAVLAFGSALCYGAVDFAGGLVSRRMHFCVAAFLGQVGAVVLAVAAAVAFPASAVTAADLGWGAGAGLGSALATGALLRGLSRGAMSVVVPVSAVAGAVVSVACAVAVLGNRPGPIAWWGIALAVPALWLTGRSPADGAARGRQPVQDGLLAGVGAAVQYVTIAQADPAAGLWPIAAGRLVAACLLLPAAAPRLARSRPSVRHAAAALLAGSGTVIALVLYLAATHHGMLAITVVLASLYPVVPTVLGIAVLGERVSRAQAAGLAAAVAAVALLPLG